MINSDEDDESDTDDRPWAGGIGSADRDGVGDVTENADWSQYERERSKMDNANNGGTENMWSDKESSAGGMQGNGNGNGAPNTNTNNENALGPVRGVVTVSPTVFPTQRNHGGLDEIDVDRNHRYNSPHGKNAVFYFSHVASYKLEQNPF